MRRILILLSAVLACAILLPIILFALLQTQPGANELARAVSSLLSTPDASISITDPRLAWDGSLRVATISIADDEGAWLNVSGVETEWRPLALLRGKLQIDRLAVNAINLERLPVRPAARKPRAKSGFAIPLAVEVSSIRLDDIVLAAPVAGTPVRLYADGNVTLNPAPATVLASVRIRRDDDIAGRLDADVAYRLGDNTLRFELKASEPRGGLIARLFDIAALPAIDLALRGDGPLDDWRSTLTIALDGRETVSGNATLSQSATGKQNETRRLAFALDGQLAELLPTDIAALFAGKTSATGTIELARDFSPLTGEIDASSDALTLAVSGNLAPSNLKASVSAALKRPVAVRLRGRALAVDGLSIAATLTGAIDKADWSATLQGHGVSTSEGQLTRLAIEAHGQDADLRQSSREIPAAIDMEADIAELSDPRLAAFTGATHVSTEVIVRNGARIEIANLDLSAPTLRAKLSGDYTPEKATAKGRMVLNDISAFSRLAGRPLRGAGTLSFDASGTPADGAGSVAIVLDGDAIAVGLAQLDGLLGGASRLRGTLSRAADGSLQGSKLTLATPALEVALDGATDLATVDGAMTARIADLGVLNPAMRGAIRLETKLSGTLGAPRITARLTGDKLTLQGEPVENLELTADITASTSTPSGTVRLKALLRGQPLTGGATFATDEAGIRRLDDITLTTARTRLSGQLTFDAEGKPAGALDLSSPDLSEIAPLLLQKLSGALTARVVIARENGETIARLSARGENLQRDGTLIGAADITATAGDLFTLPRIDGQLTATDVRSGSVQLPSVTVTASGTTAGTDFEANAKLDRGDLALAGKVERTAQGIAVTLTKGDGQYRDLRTRLSAPARAVIRDSGAIDIETATLALGGGSATVSGFAGKTLKLAIDLRSVPAALVNAVAPGLGLDGFLTGTVDITGALTEPAAAWSVVWNGAEATAITGYGLPAITLKSDGKLIGKRLTHTSVVTTGAGGSLTATGAVVVAPDARLDMTVSGTLPFGLIQRRLTAAGLRLTGDAALDMRVGGSISAPVINGAITTRDATAVSFKTGLVVKNIAATAQIATDAVEISALTGEIGGGGSLSGHGTIGFGPSLPAQLALKISDGVYADGRIVTATLDADLDLSGPLAGVPTLKGRVVLKKADIAIPQTLVSTLSPVTVTHVNAPANVTRQATNLRKGPSDGASGLVNLELEVSAPGRIFVHGRGLQAELGGTIRILGTTAAPVTSGAFTLRRGTLSVLSRLLTFTKGTITFLGSFDPLLDFIATSNVNSTTISIGVAGNASDPKVRFSSSPEYPQEEILALLLFDRNLSSLSAAQIAQLASAVAALGGADPLDKLRKSLGIDAIDITSDANNNAAVSVGKRLSDNVTLGVQQGSEQGSSRVTVDIDVTKNIRARGEAGANGSSKAGIFFEKEY